MKQVRQFIEEGQGRAAVARLSGMLAEYPDKMGPAIELTIRILQDAMAQGQVAGVRDFLATMDSALPPEALRSIREAMGERIDRIGPWVDTLDRLTRERLARECRKAVTLKDIPAAAELGARLLDRSATSEDLDKNARYLAHALSDLHSDRDRALKVVALVPRAGGSLAERGGEHLARYFADAVRSEAQRGFDRGEQQWSRQLLETVIELSGKLPGVNRLGEPTVEEMAEFQGEVTAIFEAALSKGRRDDLIDAMMVLVEFAPVDEAAIKNAAGVEERMFLRLGNRAKLVAVRSLRAAGNQEKIRRAVVDLAGSSEGHGRTKLLAGLMGGLGHGDFYPWLAKALESTHSKLEESWIVDAVSRLDHPKSAATLLARFAHVLKHIGDRDNLARADDLLKGLARVSRARGISPEQRNAIVGKVVQLSDRSDKIVGYRAAERLFANRPEEIEPELREWAVRRLVEAMWGQPLAGFAAGPASANGWRQPFVTAIIRQGQPLLPATLEAGEKVKARYSGAMGAFGSVIEGIGDERAVPLLEAMLRTAFLHDDKKNRTQLMDEKVKDVATGEMKDLDRDDVIHSLLHALREVGGASGIDAALDMADQVQAGRLKSPGEKTTTILFDTKSAHGKIGEVSRHAEFEEMDERERKAALSDAKGGLFGKKEKRIAAMARLGAARTLEAIPILVDALGDKDPMVGSAAQVALGQFMMPLPGEKDFEFFWEAALERPKALKGAAVDRLLDFIRKEMPKNPPYDRLFNRMVVATVEDEELAHRMKGAALRTESRPASLDEPGESPDGEAAGTPAGAGNRTVLDIKREYMQARQAWLRGGKQGPAPEPPAI